MAVKGSVVVFSGTFTGYTRKVAEERAVKAGCNVRKAVSKNTDILICGDEPGGKLEDAERLGITVLDQTEWEAELKKGAPAASDDEEDMESEDSESATTSNSKSISDINEKKVVFTGTFSGYTRKEAEQRAMKAGCFVTKAVSSKTDILIAGDAPGSKVTEAKRHGVTVLDQKGWESLLKKCSADDDEEDMDSEASGSSGDAPPAKTTKPKLKRVRTHQMSDAEDNDDTPAKPKLVKRRSQRLSDQQDSTEPPPAKKARVEPTPVAGASRPKCRYWDKCYRKDPVHKKNFRHPLKGDKAAAANAEVDDDDDMDVDGVSVEPLNALADGETAEVAGGLHGASKYTVKRVGDHYTCTCTAWKMQRTGVDTRTCRHLRSYLGDEYEDERTKFDPEVKPQPSRSLKHKTVNVLLAHKWTEDVDPKGWWLSEKLDGVRAYWDGKCFYSRLGNEFLPPKWFIKGLPTDVCLDGELFGGRGKFQSTVSIVKTAESSRWKDVKYCVFDAPSLAKQPFEKRIKAINDIFENDDIPYAYALEQEKCRGKDHMFEELKRVEKLGGEGVMVREPGSKYVGSRSKTLLKLKSFHDAEAVVIGFEKGKGRNASVVGALVCRMACGTQFKVGSGLSDKDRRSPPKKGSIITYRFQELTNGGHPRFPTFVGVRIDLDEPCDAVLPPKPSDG